MADDPPFRVEYAKSNRSSCKLCRNGITKDSLRLAKMVQSPHFDGKIPNWYHYSCFFKIAKVTSIAQVGGMGGVRWDDQQKIQQQIEGSSSVEDVGGAVGGANVGGTTSLREDMAVEYSKSGRAKCAHCGSNIEKDVPRISKKEYYSNEDWESYLDKWHHVKCFIDAYGYLGLSPTQLMGFGSLRMETQQELMSAFPGKSAKAGKKRKVNEESTSTGDKKSTKKPKMEDPEEKPLKEQTELIWKIRDQLQANLTSAQLRVILDANKQNIPSGESKLLDRCSDGIIFGAIEPCETCNGQLVPHTYHYQCTGNVSEWTKCTETTTKVKRKKWLIPKNLRDGFDFLKNYKYQPRERIFPKAPPKATPSIASSSSSSVALDPTKPMSGFKVYVIGRLGKTKAEITSQVKSLGGQVVSTVKPDTTICISNQSEIDKQSKSINKVMDCDVPVVDVEYLDNIDSGGALAKITSHKISSWGAPRDVLPSKEETDFGAPQKSLERAFEKIMPSKMKMKVKGGAVVDPDSGLDDTYHVFERNGNTYNAVLGLVDIVRGTNSYYKLQVLESDKGKDYKLFRAWGRVGTTIGGNKLEDFDDEAEYAVSNFYQLYEEKTGVSWFRKDTAGKVPGKFYPLQIDYGDDTDSAFTLASAGSKSKLVPQIQELVKMIFDIENMKRAMKEFEIDMKKMPLGKLSKSQIQSAYSVLNDLQKEISGNKNPTKLLDGSNRFYTLIPHDFGMQKPPLLDNEDAIKTKTSMLDNLMEIEIAYSLLKTDREEEDSDRDPLDIHFEKLKTDMKVIPNDSEEFKRLVEYVSNTHAVTHNQYQLEVMEIFELTRRGESKRFKPFSKFDNRMLLWHGSRLTNYVGILSQGLRIAPPEAPVTGYMFGKGVYFADMVSKSANYCRTSRSDPIGLMLLCEVALGEMYEREHAEFITDLPAGKHSTKGIGCTAPDPAGNYVTESGCLIPMGKGMQSTSKSTSLLYNEYIVYDVAQISMKYLFKMNFKFR